MRIKFETFTVCKRFPLTISRGTTSTSVNLWIRLEAENIEGWGEASPFSVLAEDIQNTDKLIKELVEIIPSLETYHPLQRQAIEQTLLKAGISTPLRAAINIALYDWLGNRAGLPLWRLWGLDPATIVPTSVTIGINTAEGARKRAEDWQKLYQPKVFKLKLGNPQGIGADQAMVLAVRAAVGNASLMVDANGGWNLDQAIFMCDWLATQDVAYVEQPLPVAEDKKLHILKKRSPLPIFVDESCFNSQDIIRLKDVVHGVNIKIMKAGGISEVMQMVQVAKASGLKIMYGCYSDSILANTAMAHLAPMADYLDLDSHLNLTNDPFQGAFMESGKLLPPNLPGLGVSYSGHR